MLHLALALFAQPAPAPTLQVPAFDTVLDASNPEQRNGRNPFLSVGPNRTLLLDFPLLRTLQGSAITDATLTFTLADGAPRVASVRPILVRWNQDLVSFNTRRDALKWQRPGATGTAETDQPLQTWNASLTNNGRTLTITGLTQALNQMVQDKSTAYGLAITFDGTGFFASSENRFQPGPTLNLTLAPNPEATGPNLTLTPEYSADYLPTAAPSVRITNNGNQTSGPVQLTLTAGPDRQTRTIEALAPGATAVIADPWARKAKPSGEPLTVRATTSNETDPTDNVAFTYPGSIPSGANPALIAQLNEYLLPASRTLASPAGSNGRLIATSVGPVPSEDTDNPARDALTAALGVSPAAVLTADSRNDTAWAASFVRPSPVFDDDPESRLNLLALNPLPNGLTALAHIRTLALPVPAVRTLILDVRDRANQQLPQVGVTLEGRTVASSASGIAIMQADPARLNPFENSRINVTINRGMLNDTIALNPLDVLYDAIAGNRPVANAVLYASLSDAAPDTSVNLLTNATLNPITETLPLNSILWPNRTGRWIVTEYDLGRDRNISAISLPSPAITRAEIWVKSTGEVGQGRRWIVVPEPSQTDAAIAARAVRARVVRVKLLWTGEGEPPTIGVFPLVTTLN